MRETLDELIAAGPWPQRVGLKALVGLGRRPRGRALLSHSSLASQAANSLIALAAYDEPDAAKALGWDAAAVAERGRRLRRLEGRP
jgi:hypothetical protein